MLIGGGSMIFMPGKRGAGHINLYTKLDFKKVLELNFRELCIFFTRKQ